MSMGGRYSLPYLIYSFSMEPLIVCLRMSMHPHIFIIYIIANFPVTISACAHVRNTEATAKQKTKVNKRLNAFLNFIIYIYLRIFSPFVSTKRYVHHNRELRMRV